MDKIINLKGIVISKFGSISAFSKEIGWCYSKTNRIVNGRQLPDASEIKDMARALISMTLRWYRLFFKLASTNGT